jgi:hypothetical protein
MAILKPQYCMATAPQFVGRDLGASTQTLQWMLNGYLLTLASLAASMLLSYAILTHLVKVWFVRRWGM